MLAKLFKNLFRARADRSAATCAEMLQRAAATAQAGQLNAALEIYHACLEAYPQSLDACLGAAGVLTDLCAIDEAVAHYACAMEIAPASGAVFSAWLFHLHYQSPAIAGRLFDAHRRYGTMMQSAPRRAGGVTAPVAERRLRVGYVSPNFSRHSVGYFIEPVMRCHARQDFEIFCYYTHPLADDATARMRALADGWRDVAATDDRALERLIREDGIDILVDLAGHSKGNRLGVFARRAAPVQMSWLGYPDTTGLDAVDYRITDATADPPPAEERHSERLLRIDDCFLCYQPPPDAPPVALRESAGAMVFSSFNNIAKLNVETIGAWGEILAAVPGSRLALKAPGLDFPDTVDRLLENLERAGIDPARIDLHGWIADRRRHLGLYGQIDIALDTYPYNGTTTSCEALWMGVPVVTRAGDVHMSRVGASLLRCAGLENLIADSAADYVKIAVALAHDAAGRNALRVQLRSKLLASPLLDHAGFTRKLEAGFRETWTDWCEQKEDA